MAHLGGWIGVDLDGTLAHYDGWKGVEHIGEPIVPMVERVKAWLKEGIEVRIFTARCSQPNEADSMISLCAIQAWSRKVFGVALPVTNIKDFGMTQLWDDRAIQVEMNTGRVLGEA